MLREHSFNASKDAVSVQFDNIQSIVVMNSKVTMIVKSKKLSQSPTSEIAAVGIDSIGDYHLLYGVRSYKENGNDHYISLF